MAHSSIQLVVSIVIALASLGHVRAECRMADDQCEFWLDVSWTLTMMNGRDAVYAHKGKLYKYDLPEGEINQTTPHQDPNLTVIGDGWEVPRIVVVVNGTLPGPPIEVYEGQKVVIHVKNKLLSDGVTIHWHGLHQKDTPWMDGVAFITQCPIPPGASFTYRFTASPKGTFWYHSHIGTQRGQGLYGAFVIREKKVQAMGEHIMIIQDWNHDWDADVTYLRMELGSFLNRTRQRVTHSLDGGRYSNFYFQSAVINGRGRYFAESNLYHKQTPLTVYDVKQGNKYRFRVVGAGNVYPYRVSVEGHAKLTVVASDGYDLSPIDVESFIINPGERYDFIVEANQAIDNYWVRADSLEVDVVNHVALAIMRYEGAPEADPMDRGRPCSATNRCLVYNCPFKHYPKEEFSDCKAFTHGKALVLDKAPGDSNGNVEDIFLNFAFPGTTYTPGSANGKQLSLPPAPPLTQPKEFSTVCKPEDNCGEQKVCKCALSLDLKFGKTYQLIMTNHGKGRGWGHPVHMHGHSFHVVKMGFPTYNETTGLLLESNKDIDCRGGVDKKDSFCNSATWTNSSWGGNDVPGLDLLWGPRKDTLIVPTGGYAVIRFKADNPGVWLMHCHIGLHSVDGMAVMLNESFERQLPPPKGFPKCGNFDFDDVDTSSTDSNTKNSTPGISALTDTSRSVLRSDDEYCADLEVFWAVLLAFVAVIIIQFIINICLHRRNQSAHTKGGIERNYQNDGFTG